LYAIYNKADHLILGGVIYNTYLCAKYGVSIRGVSNEDIKKAKELVEKDKEQQKIIELPHIVESDTLEGKIEGTRAGTEPFLSKTSRKAAVTAIYSTSTHYH
jgi:phosphoglycerate kinase